MLCHKKIKDTDKNILWGTIMQNKNCIIQRCPLTKGIKPVFNDNSKVLMIGSITARDGIEKGYYYGSRWNSFWKLLDYVILFKENGYDFHALEKKFHKTENTFVFSNLKEQLNQNYKNNYENHGLFLANLKEIQKKFEQELINRGIAICDIFKTCYVKNNSSLDSDILLNDREHFPFETYGDVVRQIICNGNIKAIVCNSDFVLNWLGHLNVQSKDIPIIQVISPSTSRRLRLETKFNDWCKIKNFL